MAFKQNPDKKVRLEELNKTALIKTVKQLRTRETKLLNQIAKLEAQVDLYEQEIELLHTSASVADPNATHNLAAATPPAFPWDAKS